MRSKEIEKKYSILKERVRRTSNGSEEEKAELYEMEYRRKVEYRCEGKHTYHVPYPIWSPFALHLTFFQQIFLHYRLKVGVVPLITFSHSYKTI